MNLEQLVLQVLEEDNVAGGAGSAFGPGVTSTATPFSGDNYARGDARNLFGGISVKGKKKKKSIKPLVVRRNLGGQTM
jgi:hypothetical protein